jgi:two-component system, LytTR family, sensor histidine kinase AlgZ
MQQKSRQILRFLWINTVAAVMAPVLVWVLSPRTTFVSLLETFAFSFLHAQIIGGLASYTIPKLARMLARRHPVLQWLALIVVLVLVAVAGCILAGAAILVLHLIPFSVYRAQFPIILKICVVITLQIGIVMKIYEGVRVRLEQTTLDLRSKELERERALKLATEARLASLASRVHPHFLFNALNSISSLIQEDPVQADRLVERMAALLRFSLDSSQRGLVPLGDEVSITADYLEIEKARFGARLMYRVDVADDLLQIEVPPLSVQTLVENSVKYAISPVRAGGEVHITASRNGDGVLLAVSDTGPGFDISRIPTGHGLENLQSRLVAVFGEKSRLTSTSCDGRTAVVINIPQAKINARIPG